MFLTENILSCHHDRERIVQSIRSREIPLCTFPITIIDNVENCGRDTVVYQKKKFSELIFFFFNSDNGKFWRSGKGWPSLNASNFFFFEEIKT